MGTCVHFSRSSPSNSWWQTMVGWQVLSRPSAAEGGGRRPAFTGPATQPYSATEVDGWQRLSRVSQNRAAVQPVFLVATGIVRRIIFQVVTIGIGALGENRLGADIAQITVEIAKVGLGRTGPHTIVAVLVEKVLQGG